MAGYTPVPNFSSAQYGAIAVNPNGSFAGPMGPSSPGYVQGTANTVKNPAQGVLGASTGPSYSAPQQQPQQQQQQQQQPQVDPYAQVRSGISSAWDSYLGSLGDTGSYLNDQQSAQNNIANDQLTQGQNTINSQKAQSLKDISNTTRNAFQAGNNYLGSMGAGDSSAANQYAFAINQQAGKQTGDLNNFVNTQMQQLQSQHDQQISSIANWFAQQQAALKQQIAQGNLQKGQDLTSLSTNILNQAISATNQIKANTQNQYNSLLQWASNNSGSLGQLQHNIAAIPQAMGQISMQGGGNASPIQYGGYAPVANTTKTDIFGQPLK